LEEALWRLRQIEDTFGVYFALRHLAMVATVTNDPRAGRFAEECLSLCETHGASLSQSWALWVIGLRQWNQDDAKQAAKTTI
jgi:hypothetical protein